MPVAGRWFVTTQVGDRLNVIVEPYVHFFLRANIWHLRGRDRDLIVDTGLGVASLREHLPDLFERDPKERGPMHHLPVRDIRSRPENRKAPVPSGPDPTNRNRWRGERRSSRGDRPLWDGVSMGMRGDGDVMAGPGHRGGPRPRGRDDAGDLGLEHAVITFALSVVMILTAVVINDLISGRGSLVYLHAAVVLGMSAAAAALIAALGKWVWGPRERRAEAERVERLDRLRAEKGASLSRWMGIPAGRPLTNSDVWVWRDYTASGVTDSIAEEWYAHGYHPGVAAAALQADVDRAEVDELAAVMARVGAHDGRDRGALNDLIGWHMHIGVADVDHYAVLGRWLALPLPLVEERARQVMADQVHGDTSSEPGAGRRHGWAKGAHEVGRLLYVLERESAAAAGRFTHGVL